MKFFHNVPKNYETEDIQMRIFDSLFFSWEGRNDDK